MTDYSVVVTQSCEAAFRLQVPFFNKPFFKFTAKVPKENCLVQAEIFLAVSSMSGIFMLIFAPKWSMSFWFIQN